METIQVLDIAGDPARRRLWSPLAQASLDLSPDGLPPGQASPMGFWLTRGSEPSIRPDGAYEIQVQGPGTAPPPLPEEGAGEPWARPILTARVKAPDPGTGELVLTFGPRSAHVAATEACWRALAEPVLLAVCQAWRFGAIEAELDRLTERARGDLGHATTPGLRSLAERHRLADAARAVRGLVLDLGRFEGPLTDPLAFCTSERSAQAYQALAGKLHLEAWGERIDQRVELLEDVYQAVIDRLLEFKNFLVEAALVVVILLILLVELALTGANLGKMP